MAGSSTPGPGKRVAERAVAVVLARGCLAERDVAVQRLVLVAGRGLDRGDDLARDAELRERAEGRVLVGPEVAHGLVEADQPLLDQVVGLAAGDEVRARLQADEAGVAAEERVERGVVAVPGADDEADVVLLSLQSFCGTYGGLCAWHGLPPLGRREGMPRTSATLTLRLKVT